MPKPTKYNQIRKLREMLLGELKIELGIQSLTLEHLKLVELRLQSLIHANLDDKEVEKEEGNWKNKDAKN